MGETKQFVEQNLKSWNSHNKEAWTRDVADDADVSGPGGLKGTGRELKGMFYSMWTDAFPDNRITPAVIAEDGENGILEARFEGTHTGVLNAPTGPIPATRKHVNIPFVTLTKIKGGKFASLHLYFDQVELMTQLGLMPAPVRA